MNAATLSLDAIQSDLNTGMALLKKSHEWEKEHGLGYHLITLALFCSGCLPLMLYAFTRTNPYRGDANLYCTRWRMNMDAYNKAHGKPPLPTLGELLSGKARPTTTSQPSGPQRPPAARPCPQARARQRHACRLTARRLRSRGRRLRHSSALVGMSGHDNADMGLRMVAGFIAYVI